MAEKTLNEKLYRELDRLMVRMKKRGIYPLAVAALWLDPEKLAADEKGLGATVSIYGPVDSNLTSVFLHQNAARGLRALANLVMEQHPESFTEESDEETVH